MSNIFDICYIDRHHGPQYGPSFGSDLILYGDEGYGESYCYSRYYDKSIRETDEEFSVEEYEIFQIMKE
ncbi:hypothetical protein C1646_769050 [Rhizophagus diaphanus]|nr:hypothetical protein C1646_769050 [Rhizophagus diaphanus] [Rhizophagus sp. MUCL 43196]